MHPIERLRYVARSGGGDDVELVAESARALASFADDPAGLVAAARRLLVRHPTSGPMWSMAARLVTAADPWAEAAAVASAAEDDPVPAALAAALPDEATVVVVGWPVSVLAALVRRGDATVLAVDDGSGVDVGRVLARVDVEVVDVPAEGVGAAAAHADVVALEAVALGPDAAIASPGSRAAAAVARHAGGTVWLTAPAGSVVPAAVYAAGPAAALTSRPVGGGGAVGSFGSFGHDEVPLDLVDRVVGPDGPVEPAEAARWAGPLAPELLRGGSTPGTHRPGRG
ncbi:MAG: hypothetical protein GXY13_04590 [Acidimicrobiales bacterium]|nr:hypothetical protein [Acidimicrobiales bacterium]